MRVRRSVLHSRVGVRTQSVQEDWCAWLPANKAQVYDQLTHQLETSYNIFSVTLDQALQLRRAGRISLSSEALAVIPGFCKRLTDPLAGLLHGLREHARHYGTVPNTDPLSPDNFQTARGQRTAKMNDLLSRVLLSQRSQFLHKTAALEELVACLMEELHAAAEEVGLGLSLARDADWHAADTIHFDLNTCLREAFILLRSFLVSLPDAQLDVFEKAASLCMHAEQVPNRNALQSPRRMAAAGGK